MALPFFGKKEVRPAPTKPKKDLDTDSSRVTHGFTRTPEDLLFDKSNQIQVSQGPDEESIVEEATILYASGNSMGARVSLEAALRSGGGKSAKNVWYMLLDLYRLMGEQEAFEELALEFSRKFEMSPLGWDQGSASPLPTLPRSTSPVINLSGNLSVEAYGKLENMVNMGMSSPRMRIDFSHTKFIDDEGCRAFLLAIAELKRLGVTAEFIGIKQALSLTEDKINVEEQTNQNTWLFVLALMQQKGEQDPFEEMALNYAITFEESPPSWEDPPEQKDPVDSNDLLQQEEVSHNHFVMEGVITGQSDVFTALADYATEHSKIDIDASHLTRMEFVSAGALFNQIANFQAQSKRTVIHNPNAMVAALLHVMGVDQIAQIERKNV